MAENNGQPQLNTGTAGDLIAAGKTVQQVQTPYATAVAVQKPRDLAEVQRRCLEEAKLAGADFYYGWPVTSREKQPDGSYITKKTRVEGISGDGAMAIARNFGNAALLQRPVQETASAFIFTSAFVDLETGFTVERSFRMDKNWEVHGKMPEARKMDIRFAIGVTKSSRNVVARAMPIGIVKRTIAAAKDSAANDIVELIKKRVKQLMVAAKTSTETEAIRKQAFVDVRDRLVAAFLKIDKRLTLEFIEGWIDLPRGAWDVQTLAMLTADLTGLQSGQHSADELFEIREVPSETGAEAVPPPPPDMSPGDPATHQGHDTPLSPQEPKAEDTTPQQRLDKLLGTAKLAGMDHGALAKWTRAQFGGKAPDQLTVDEFKTAMQQLRAMVAEQDKKDGIAPTSPEEEGKAGF